MTIDTGLILVGAIITLLPFLGFPASWDTVFFFILGVIVIALGIAVRRGAGRVRSAKPRTFVDTNHPSAPFEGN